jgi:hypothetical protein
MRHNCCHTTIPVHNLEETEETEQAPCQQSTAADVVVLVIRMRNTHKTPSSAVNAQLSPSFCTELMQALYHATVLSHAIKVHTVCCAQQVAERM